MKWSITVTNGSQRPNVVSYKLYNTISPLGSFMQIQVVEFHHHQFISFTSYWDCPTQPSASSASSLASSTSSASPASAGFYLILGLSDPAFFPCRQPFACCQLLRLREETARLTFLKRGVLPFCHVLNCKCYLPLDIADIASKEVEPMTILGMHAGHSH